MKARVLSAFAGILFALLVFSCRGKSTSGMGGSVKFQQYFLQGQQLYLTHCSNCHQENGSGLGRVFPPLDTSDYMDASVEKVVCLMRHGLQGEVVVNGVSYIQGMSGNNQLTDLEIAQIATFIYNSWSHQRGLIDVKETTSILSRCEEQQ